MSVIKEIRLSRSLKVIGTETDRSVTCEFLLTFHSNHGLSRTVSEINRCEHWGVADLVWYGILEFNVPLNTV